MLTSFAAASPVRTSATQEQEQDSMAAAQDCSTKQLVLFAYWNPATCCWRTSQRCLLGGWMPYSGRWPRSGMTAGGIAYRLLPLVPRISGTGCSLWPTPRTQMTRPVEVRNGGHRHNIETFVAEVESGNIPRPLPMDTMPVAGNESRGSRRCEAECLRNESRRVERFPTSQSRDWKSGSTKSDYGNSRPLSEAVSGQLNPTWVEWLQGFPLGWTEV